MSENVTPIWHRAPDCHYTIFVTHRSGGDIEVTVEGIGNDQRSRDSARAALLAAAEMLDRPASAPSGERE